MEVARGLYQHASCMFRDAGQEQFKVIIRKTSFSTVFALVSEVRRRPGLFRETPYTSDKLRYAAGKEQLAVIVFRPSFFPADFTVTAAPNVHGRLPDRKISLTPDKLGLAVGEKQLPIIASSGTGPMFPAIAAVHDVGTIVIDRFDFSKKEESQS